jgi:hypothetical protein
MNVKCNELSREDGKDVGETALEPQMYGKALRMKNCCKRKPLVFSALFSLDISVISLSNVKKHLSFVLNLIN